MAGTAAGPFGLLLESTLQILSKHLPGDPDGKPCQRIGTLLKLFHSVFVVEQSGILFGYGFHGPFYHTPSSHSSPFLIPMSFFEFLEVP